MSIALERSEKDFKDLADILLSRYRITFILFIILLLKCLCIVYSQAIIERIE